MLVLSRKRLEGIVVGEEIRITVVKIDRNHVRIGIEAPDEVMVIREELVHDEEAQEARTAWELSDSPIDTSTTPEEPA